MIDGSVKSTKESKEKSWLRSAIVSCSVVLLAVRLPKKVSDVLGAGESNRSPKRGSSGRGVGGPLSLVAGMGLKEVDRGVEVCGRVLLVAKLLWTDTAGRTTSLQDVVSYPKSWRRNYYRPTMATAIEKRIGW